MAKAHLLQIQFFLLRCHYVALQYTDWSGKLIRKQHVITQTVSNN